MVSQVLPLRVKNFWYCPQIFSWSQLKEHFLAFLLHCRSLQVIICWVFFEFPPQENQLCHEGGPQHLPLQSGQCQSPCVGHKGPEHLLFSLQDPYLLLIFKMGSQGLTPLSRSGRKRHQLLCISHSSDNCLTPNAK